MTTNTIKLSAKASMNQYETLFERHPGNPILTGKDWPYSINSVFNAGATLLPDGSTLLLCRVEDRRGLSHLCAARSVNGVDDWQIDREPTLLPDAERFPEEIWGIEDPRITYLPELKKYAVAYTSYSRGGPGVSVALTHDFPCILITGGFPPPPDLVAETERARLPLLTTAVVTPTAIAKLSSILEDSLAERTMLRTRQRPLVGAIRR